MGLLSEVLVTKSAICSLKITDSKGTWKQPEREQTTFFCVISTWKWKVQIRALACICWSLHKQCSYQNWNYKYHICGILLLSSCSVCNVNVCFWKCLGWGASGIFTSCYFPKSVNEVISSSGLNTFLPLLNVSISNHHAFWEKQSLVLSSKQMNNELAVFKFPFKALIYIFFHVVTPEPSSVGSGALYSETVQSKWQQDNSISQSTLHISADADTLNCTVCWLKNLEWVSVYFPPLEKTFHLNWGERKCCFPQIISCRK